MSASARKAIEAKAPPVRGPINVSGPRLTLVAFAVRGPAFSDGRDAITLAFALKGAVEQLWRQDAQLGRVFELFFYDGLRAAEIAETVGIAPDQVGAAIERAREAVRLRMLSAANP